MVSEILFQTNTYLHPQTSQSFSRRWCSKSLALALILLTGIFLSVGIPCHAQGGDDALFIDEEGNLKLQKGGPVNEFSNDVTLEGNSDLAVPTEKAVKTYIDTKDEAVRNHIESELQPYLKKGGEIVGNHLRFLKCREKTYACTPLDCLAKCLELKMRMATYSEVYAWASGGRNHCAFMWMLHPIKILVKAYPMYSNRTASGCGPRDTGNIPRMVGTTAHKWKDEDKADCACSSLK